jgi:alkaline phosphatase D
VPEAVSRRSVLRRTLLVPLAAALGGGALAATSPRPGAIARATPGLLRSRPNLTHGIAAGDAHADGALVWARSDVPATMIVETAATERFANPITVRGPLLTPDTDGTGRVRITGLEPGRQVHYRVTLEARTAAAANR